MLRPRAADGAVGDWSETGTFLRKPPSGWLHEDRELMDGSSINYEVKYLGSVEVNQSMRTLKFGVRTQVTKEAILRLAEKSGEVYAGKKRKVPKQINKLLGNVDTRWVGNVNLAICVDDLRISSATGNVIMKHSLPSISFASGGDGPTMDYIGYVAKDPVHGRACHVFDCTGCAQYVLSSIGQAFELRYKIYLSTPRVPTQPVEVRDSWDSNAWGGTAQRDTSSAHVYDIGPGEIRSISATPPNAGGIYSDVPEFPPPDSPPPPLPPTRPRVYSNLPGFPDEEGGVTYDNGQGVPRLDNPYDTMVMEGGGARGGATAFPTSNGMNPTDYDYDESSKYSKPLMTIRQVSSAHDSAQLIDLTPAPVHHDYTNIGPDGEILDNQHHHPSPKQPTRPPKPPKPPRYDEVSSPERETRHVYDLTPAEDDQDALYDNKHVERVLSKNDSTDNEGPNMYDDPHSLEGGKKNKKVLASLTPAGTYDNPSEIMPSLHRGQGACEEVKYEDPNEIIDEITQGRRTEEGFSNEANEYDVANSNMYDVAGEVEGAGSRRSQPLTSPKFDDTIYMRRPGSGRKATPMENIASIGHALSDPLAPLPHQQYFHGAISRVEAEALLEKDGEFLIRESSKKQGQFVLTGMAGGQPQHLLLMDKQGKVKSRDHEFESIPHLVSYFTERSAPLVIGNSQVYLKHPVVNINA